MNLAGLKAKIDALQRDIPMIQTRAMRKAAARSENYLKVVRIPQVDPQPVDTGLYRRAWDVRPESDGATLFNDAPYASVIEWGARPFKPPLEPLAVWFARKKGYGPKAGYDSMQYVGIASAIRKSKGTRTGPAKTPLQGREKLLVGIISAALSIRDRIASRGFKPRHVATGAMPEFRKLARESLDRETSDEMKKRGLQ